MTTQICQKDLTSLDFPLNVFAYSLYLQESSAEERTISQVQVTQQRVTDSLLAYLPEPPIRILEIGTGSGTTALQLAGRGMLEIGVNLGTTALELPEYGYTVTCINPDSEQVALAKQRVKDNATLSISFMSAWEIWSSGSSQEDLAPDSSFILPK